MYAFFESPYRVLRLSSALLSGGLFMLLVGVALAYFLDAYLSLPALVGAHALTILGPTAIKLGYVARLLALYRLHPPQAARPHGVTR